MAWCPKHKHTGWALEGVLGFIQLLDIDMEDAEIIDRQPTYELA